jgi:hypothetical protein
VVRYHIDDVDNYLKEHRQEPLHTEAAA